MSKPGDQVSAAGSSPSGPARQHQSHPEETEEELREHQGLSSSSSSSSCTSAQESGPLRGLVIKQEPPDPQEQEEREQRERQAEKDFLFRQVRIQSKRKKKNGEEQTRSTFGRRVHSTFQEIHSAARHLQISSFALITSRLQQRVSK